MKSEITIGYTDFVYRQFKEDFKGTNLSKCDKEQLLSDIRKRYNSVKVVDGYAPFCKLLFMNNPTDVKTGIIPITMSNQQFLQSDYIKRSKDEKAVLTRFFNIPNNLKHEIPLAKYLMIVLYSKEQINSENKDKIKEGLCERFKYDYGIVSINAQMVDSEEPINPITMMRNELGESEGGSGVPMNIKDYEKSVEFWRKNAIVFAK